MRIRRRWLRRVLDLTQRSIGALVAGRPPHHVARELLSKWPPPTTRLEEMIFYGLLFEVAAGGLGTTPSAARRAARRALRKLLPRTSTQQLEMAERIERLARALVRHHARPLRLRDFARQEGLHETTVRRMFRQTFGVSPQEFRTRLRVCRAVHLFREETRDVMAVARLAGYESEKNFYRAVRQVTGLTPAQLRDQQWQCRWATCSQIANRKPGAPGACAVQRKIGKRRRGSPG